MVSTMWFQEEASKADGHQVSVLGPVHVPSSIEFGGPVIVPSVLSVEPDVRRGGRGCVRLKVKVTWWCRCD